MLRKSLENLSDYHAATANMQVVVDVEHDTDLLPSFIKGERTLFVAAGSVDAAVDFRRAAQGRGGRVGRPPRGHDHAAAGAPDARRGSTRPRSRIYDRDRGVLDRIGDAVSDDGGADQQELYALAERSCRRPRPPTRRCGATAERNTRAMLEGLLRGLGFERITIRFERAPV